MNSTTTDPTEDLFDALLNKSYDRLAPIIAALSAGANANAVYSGNNSEFKGMTPLMIAVHRGFPPVVLQELIHSGADATQRYSNGDTLLIAAARLRNVSGAYPSSKYSADPAGLNSPNVKSAWAQVISMLVDQGVDINAVNGDRESALSHVTPLLNIDYAKELLEKGAQVDNPNQAELPTGCSSNTAPLLSIYRAEQMAKNRAKLAEKREKAAHAEHAKLRATFLGEGDQDLEAMQHRQAASDRLMARQFPEGFAKALDKEIERGVGGAER